MLRMFVVLLSHVIVIMLSSSTWFYRLFARFPKRKGFIKHNAGCATVITGYGCSRSQQLL